MNPLLILNQVIGESVLIRILAADDGINGFVIFFFMGKISTEIDTALASISKLNERVNLRNLDASLEECS